MIFNKRGHLNELILLISLAMTMMLNGQTSNISGTINIYTPVTGFDTTLCPSKIVVQSSVGLAVNDKILIIQMKGCAFDSSNTSSFGTINNLNGAGNYEIATISAMNNNTLTINGKLVNQYFLSGSVQVVRIATYTNATVNGVLTCAPWNGTVGGVLIFEVAGQLQLGANIDVSGRGFRGGVISNNPDGSCGSGSTGYFYDMLQGGSSWSTGGAEKGEGIGYINTSKRGGRGTLVNGGGGGNKHNTGGGGGGNFTAGGKGGNELSGCSTHLGGIGGLALSTYYSSNRLFLGGGGGCGDANNGVGTAGERGGGMVIIICNTLVVSSGAIFANGSSVSGLAGAAADGAGGGGAGGTVFLKTSFLASTLHVEANGGDGGGQNPSGYCVGPGGGGGTGTFLTSLSNYFGTYSLNAGNPGPIVSGGCINTAYGSMAGVTNTTGPLTSMNLIYTPGLTASVNAGTSSSVICSGNTISLTASGAATYTWYPGNLTGAGITATPVISTTYTLFATKVNGCTGSLTVNQIVNPLPIVTAISSSSVICSNFSVSLAASGANSYTWIPGNFVGSTFTVTPGTTITYSVTGSANNCTSMATILQSVNPVPSLTVTPSSATVCPGQLFNLSASGAANYTWTSPTTTTAILSTSINSSAIFTLTGIALTGCSATRTISVVVKPTPVLSFNTFSITCASLGSATVLSTGGIGPYSYTWTPTSQTSGTASGLFPGTYTVTVHDNGTGCIFTPTTNFAPLIPLTGTVSSSNSLVCNGVNTGTASILLAGGSSSQNFTWTSSSGVQSTPTVSGLGAGISTVNVVDALTHCAVTKTFIIIQPPAMTINIVASGQATCINQNITFTATNSGGMSGYTYTWMPGVQGNTNVVTNSSPGTYTYMVQSSDANNCLATKTIAATFLNFPNITVTSTTICPGAVGALFASGGTSYTWNTGSQLAVIIAGPLITTQYTVTGFLSACSNTAIGTIFVHPSITAIPGNNGPLCAGETLFLTSNQIQSNWSGPAGFVSSVQNPTLLTTNLSAGNYTLKVTSAQGCTASAITQVTVNPLPVFSAAGSTVCEFQNLNLTSTGLSGAGFLWTGTSFSSGIQNPVIPNADPSMTGNYTVIVTSAAGCSATAAVHASVAVSPTPSIISNDKQCRGTQLLFNGSGGGSYSWSGPGGFTSTLQNPTITNVMSGGIFSLTVINGPCSVVTTKSVTILPLPVPVIIHNSPVCEDTPIQLDGTGGVKFLWSGPGYTSVAQNNVITPASFSHAGIYSLTVTDSDSCSASISASVQIKPAPVISATGAVVCIGESAALFVTGGVSYQWTGPDSFSSTQPNPFIPIVNPINTGVYQVVATGANGCTRTEKVSITGNPFALPEAAIIASAKACLNSKFILTGSGGTEYKWKGPGNLSYQGQSLSLDILDYSRAGIYTLTVKNVNNCSATATLNVTVYNQPQGLLVLKEKNGCVPLCTSYSLESSIINAAPVTGSTLYVNGMTHGPEHSVCFKSSGTFSLNMFFEDTNHCMNSSMLEVIVYPKPQADFHYWPLFPEASIDVVQFYNSTTGERQNEWSWWFTQDSNEVVRSKDASFMFNEPGNYGVVMLTKNNWGCADTVIKTIIIEEGFIIYVPNVFTPNGDGLNDIFRPSGEGIGKYSLTVYDRWGEKVFATKDFSDGWDGSFRGSPCKSDVYVWSIEASDRSGKMKSMTGHVSILKGELPD